MEFERGRSVGLKIFKTLSEVNPLFMEKLFHCMKITHRRHIQVNVPKTAKYGDKSLSALGPYIWKSLSEHNKPENSFSKFKVMFLKLRIRLKLAFSHILFPFKNKQEVSR